MRNYISILIILFSSIIANAQSNPDEMIKKFFLEFAVNSDKAINDIYATNPNIGGITDAINNMKKIAKSYPEQLGKNYGYELISQQKCTDNFILHAYLVKYELQPMKFTFEFYKPNTTWSLYSLNFDATIDDDVEEAAKLYLDKSKH
jgi:hypothetical protein